MPEMKNPARWRVSSPSPAPSSSARRCFARRARTGGYPNLSPAEARDLLGKRSGDPDFVLLDVRTRKEFDAERIAGAVIVDYNSPSFRDEMAKLDRSKSYLVYCRTGNRTNGAVKVMRELGFPNVIRVPGRDHEVERGGIPHRAVAPGGVAAEAGSVRARRADDRTAALPHGARPPGDSAGGIDLWNSIPYL